MASQFVVILPKRALLASATMPADEVVDLGAYRVIVADCWIPKPGTGSAGGKVYLQTAATKNDDEWRDIASWVVDSTATVGGMVEVTTFLRFVRWKTDSLVAGAPIAGINVVAKE